MRKVSDEAPADTASPRTLTAVLWAGAERWGHQALSFVVFATLARLLEPTAFGVVALASLCLSFFAIFIDHGLGAAIVRLRHVDARHLSSAFWLANGISSVLLGATILAAPTVARWMGAPDLAAVLRVLAVSLALTALATVPVAILTRDLRFDTLTKRSIIGIAAGGIAGVGSAALGLGVWSLVVQQITAAAAAVIFLGRAVPWRPTIDVSGRHLRDIAGISMAVIANGVVWFVCQRADQAILGAVIGPYELALYALSMKLIVLVTELVCAPVARVALPILSRHQDDRLAFETSFVRLTIGAAVIGVPGMVGLATVAPELIDIVVGERWQPSAVVIRLLLGYGLVLVLFTLYDAAMIAKGKMALYVTLLAIQASTTLAASLLGVRWGLEGVAVAITVNIVAHGIVGFFVLHFSLGVRFPRVAPPLLRILMAAGLMAIVVASLRATVLLEAGSAVLLGATVIVGAGVYGAALYGLMPAVAAEAGAIARRLYQRTE